MENLMSTIQKTDNPAICKIIWQELWLPPVNLWNAPLLRNIHGTPVDKQHKRSFRR